MDRRAAHFGPRPTEQSPPLLNHGTGSLPACTREPAATIWVMPWLGCALCSSESLEAAQRLIPQGLRCPLFSVKQPCRSPGLGEAPMGLGLRFALDFQCIIK